MTNTLEENLTEMRKLAQAQADYAADRLARKAKDGMVPASRQPPSLAERIYKHLIPNQIKANQTRRK